MPSASSEKIKTTAISSDRVSLYTERRYHQRIGANIGVVFEQEKDLVFCNIRNLSGSGALIETEYDFQIGQVISFYATDNNFDIPLEAQVVRKERPRTKKKSRTAIGFRFLSDNQRFPNTREDMVMYLLNYQIHQQWK